jgi:hypothetical protein
MPFLILLGLVGLIVKVMQLKGVLPPDVPKDVQMRAHDAKRAVEARIVAEYWSADARRKQNILDEAERMRVYE